MRRPFAIALVGIAALTPQSLGVEFPDGRVAFDQPPIFVEANTRYPQVWLTNTTYNFIVQIPTTAGEPLARLDIQQLPGIETIYFLPQRTRAFIGDRSRQPIPLAEVTFDGHSALLTVTFDPPVPPGWYLRVEVAPVRNPQWDGTYLFAVTAFPRGGDRAMGQNIGTGRLQFYRNSNFF
ncbi:DUF2808 domain-containing protein [Thermosynechococcus sp. QKsg1]|uniref:DUF2808 domain-containing protein n=1 Tax=unclassified Thermosynechococcus TaxID=2622553 RepID=UPI002574AC65|nr:MULTISPECIES: DUF2808 domain-containing protein [unclassified Thermosynechococcus]WJI25287.1 DUF2808 domain-containing protein [Thermosynechococcus sp. B0]WNC87934.1 DUF2808 domain-containing protein [Thermosynechococcus sp. QKsg1]